jgi:hypothetical protein
MMQLQEGGGLRPRWILAALVLFVLWSGWRLTTLSTENSAEIFLGPDDPQRIAQQTLRENFSAPWFLVLQLQTGKDLTGPDLKTLAQLARTLEELPGVVAVLHRQRSRDLTVAELRRAEAESPLRTLVRLSQVEAGQYAMVVLIADAPRTERLQLDRHIELTCHQAILPTWSLSASSQDRIDQALDRSAVEVQRSFLPLLAAVMAVFLWFAFRDLRTLLAVGLLVVCVEAGALALLSLFGEPLNLLTILLPVLLLALTTALALHVVHHLRRAQATGLQGADAVAEAVRGQWLPCLLTSLTTAIAFASLGVTSLVPLRVLGISMSLGIALSYLLGFTALPVLLEVLRARPMTGLSLGSYLESLVPKLMKPRWRWWGPALFLLLAAAWAIPRLRLETNGLLYFTPDEPIRQQTEVIEQSVAGVVALELLLRCEESESLTILDRLHQLQEQAQLKGSLLSAKTLLEEGAHQMGMPVSEAGLAVAWGMADRLPEREAAIVRAYRGESGVLRATWLLPTMGHEEYAELSAGVDQVLSGLQGEFPDLQVQRAGAFPIIMRVQAELLGALSQSLAMTAALVFLLLGLLFRSARFALAAIPPTLVPLASAVALCPVLDCPLSIGTIMVFSVSLGIAVDDGIHILHGLRRGLSVRELLAEVGEAVTATTLVILAGFLTLALSSFLPTRFFGILAAVAMLVALWANLTMLPGLLAADCNPGERKRS